MRPDLVRGRNPVGKEARYGVGVQPLHVIAFEERVDDQLPVGGDFVRVAAVKVKLAHPEGVEVGSERRRRFEICAVVAGEPDQAAGLDRLEFEEMFVVFVQPREAVGSRHALEGAVGSIGPGMIGAGDPFRRHHLGAVDQAGAAVTADVGKYVDASASVASDQQRNPESVMREGVAFLR